MKAITEKELNDLKPSFDNPVELVCFDERFKLYLKRIKVITPGIKNCIGIINSLGELSFLISSDLRHYTLHKKPNEVELFWTIENFLNRCLCDSDGDVYNLVEKRKFCSQEKVVEGRKKNRQKEPAAMLDLDTYELRWL